MIVIPVKSKTFGEHFIFIDGEDFDLVKNYTWGIRKENNYYYATTEIRNVNKKRRYSPTGMHRIITNCPDGMVVDHINGNTLDNRKENLRICTYSQNGMNRKITKNKSSQYKGVCFHKIHNKYMSQIVLNKKQIFLGYFKTEEEAAKAYNDAAIKYYSEFALLNKID